MQDDYDLEVPEQEVEVSAKVSVLQQVGWSMFEKVQTLGSGAFGCVYKVKCLQSTKISSDGNERVLLSKKSIRHTKTEMMKAV